VNQIIDNFSIESVSNHSHILYLNGIMYVLIESWMGFKLQLNRITIWFCPSPCMYVHHHDGWCMCGVRYKPVFIIASHNRRSQTHTHN